MMLQELGLRRLPSMRKSSNQATALGIARRRGDEALCASAAQSFGGTPSLSIDGCQCHRAAVPAKQAKAQAMAHKDHNAQNFLGLEASLADFHTAARQVERRLRTRNLDASTTSANGAQTKEAPVFFTCPRLRWSAIACVATPVPLLPRLPFPSLGPLSWATIASKLAC